MSIADRGRERERERESERERERERGWGTGIKSNTRVTCVSLDILVKQSNEHCE